MTKRTVRLLQGLAGIVVAASIIGVVVAFFTIDVCDQQLAETGRPVEVCRHLQATDPPVVAAGVVVLAALGAFFTEISGFGISLKRAVAQATDLAQDAKQSADAAREQTRQLTESTDDLHEATDSVMTSIGRDRTLAGTATRPLTPLNLLAAEYNRIRWTTPSGKPRTAAMEGIVAQMRTAAESTDDFDVDTNLHDPDRGQRLAGYAYLYTKPDPGHAATLANNAVTEDRSFGQYWALRTLTRQLEVNPMALDHGAVRRLRLLRQDLPPDSDRARHLQQVLDLAQ